MGPSKNPSSEEEHWKSSSGDILRMKSDCPVIVFAADDRYAMPLAAALRSLLEHSVKYPKLDIWIIDDAITGRNRIRIEESVESAKADLHWLPAPVDLVAGLPIWGHFRRAIYYRLFASALLPNDIAKIIYLDVDTIARGDIGDLWDIDLNDRALLAIPYTEMGTRSYGGVSVWKELGFDPGHSYFCSGVLVVNCDKWRRERICDKVIDFIREFGNRIRWPDQDGLNAVLADEWGELDRCWHFIVKEVTEVHGEDSLTQGVPAGAKIIHFASSVKPWSYDAIHPAKKLFFHYLDMTVWAGWRPPKPVLRLLRKSLRRTVFNRHFYGKWMRRLPGIGRVWTAWRERVPKNGVRPDKPAANR
jgi:lipopolysaccharide biosynthesis glycosyltransferase